MKGATIHHDALRAVECRALRAGCRVVRRARELIGAAAARDLFRADPRNAIVLDALRGVFRDGKGKVVSPELVLDRLDDSYNWLLIDPDADTFDVDLGCLIQHADVRRLDTLVEDARIEIRREGLSIETRRRFRELAFLVDHRPPRASSIEAVLEDDELPAGVLHTGFVALDRALANGEGPSGVLGGLHPGDLVVIGGQSGHGKTTLSGEIALRSSLLAHARDRRLGGTLMVTFELSRRDLARHLRLDRGQFWHETRNSLIDPFSVEILDRNDIGRRSDPDRCVNVVAERLFERVRVLREDGREPAEITSAMPRVIIVDYAKLISPQPLSSGIEMASAIVKDGLCLGGAFDLAAYPELTGYYPAVILPTQLKPKKQLPRGERDEWMPSVDDLAECRAIEDNADTLLLIHRYAMGRGVGPIATPNGVSVEDAGILVAKARRAARNGEWIPLAFGRGRWGSTPIEVSDDHFDIGPYQRHWAEWDNPSPEPLVVVPEWDRNRQQRRSA